MVEGEVRFSGLNGIHPRQNDANVVIELRVDGDVKDSIETTYDDEGRFNATLYTPNDRELSGKEVKLSAKITNISNSQSDTSTDVTSIFQRSDSSWT